MRVLLLTKSDIEGIVSMNDVMKVVEEAFREKSLGRVEMPPKSYVPLPEYRGDFRVMPAYVRKLKAAGAKIVSVYPDNPERGLPTVMATIILLDPPTGAPIAIMDGTWITDMRTGAAGGIATKYLARKESRIIGMVGAGRQARTQLMALACVLNVEKVKVCSKTLKDAERFAREMGEKLKLSIRAVEIEEAVRGSDVVVTATPVTEPIVREEWIDGGTHINAIGADAPGKEELDPKILKKAKIVVDDFEQACHSGEVNVPLSRGCITREDIYAELGDVIAGKKPGRTSDEEITIFDSTGLAIQDIATAHLVYRRALEEGRGLEVELL